MLLNKDLRIGMKKKSCFFAQMLVLLMILDFNLLVGQIIISPPDGTIKSMATTPVFFNQTGNTLGVNIIIETPPGTVKDIRNGAIAGGSVIFRDKPGKIEDAYGNYVEFLGSYDPEENNITMAASSVFTQQGIMGLDVIASTGVLSGVLQGSSLRLSGASSSPELNISYADGDVDLNGDVVT